MAKSSKRSTRSFSSGKIFAFLKLTPHCKPHHFYEISAAKGSDRSVQVRFGRSGRQGRTITVACKAGVSTKETALRLAARRLRSAPGWHLYDPENTRSRKTGNHTELVARALRDIRQQRSRKSAKLATKAPKKTTRAPPRSKCTFPFLAHQPVDNSTPRNSTGIYHIPGAVRADSQAALLEIVFSFDTTGSMMSYLNEVRTKLRTILTQLLADLPFIRISIVAHGDYCDIRSSYILKMLDLSNDTDEIVKFVSGVSPTGGGDCDECYELVLQQVADKTSWTSASAKALVVIGDANPHPADTNRRIDWKAELDRLKEKNVRVYGVHVGGSSNSKAFYETIATQTGGAYLTLDKVDSLREMILGLCYMEATEQQAQNIADPDAIPLPADIASALESEAVDVTDALNGDDMEVDSSSSAAAPAQRLADDDVMRIHAAIHATGASSVTINGETHTVSVGSAGCRFVRVNGTTFIEQNKLKNSRFAKMALDEGKKVTWVVRRGRWGLIIDDQIVRR